MSDYPAIIDIPDVKRGDLWEGIAQIGPVVNVDGDLIGGPLSRIRCHFRHSSGEVFRLDSSPSADRDGQIIIEDAAEWIASIPEQKFLALAGEWAWDMEFFQSGQTAPLTLYQGTITVHPDVTR